MKSNPFLLAALLAVNFAIAWDEDPVATAVNANTFFSDGGSSTTIAKNTFYDEGTVATRVGKNTFIDSDYACGAERALKAPAFPSLNDEAKSEADDELV